LSGNVRIIEKNTEVLVVAKKEFGLEINVDKTQYMVMSRDQNAGRSQNIKLVTVPLKVWNSSDIWETP
jgi:hypothetical protein